MRRSILALAALAASCLLTWPAAASPKLVVKVPSGARLQNASSVDLAKQFLERQAAIPSHVVLAPERTVKLQRTTIHRFAQTHMGVPVYARGAGVAVDDQGKVMLATSHTEPNLPSSVTPAVDAATAAVIATDFARVPARDSHARLAIMPGNGEARLAWMVYAPPVLPDTYAPLTTIDALTGKVMSSVNATRYKNSAKVYLTNPVEDKGVTSTATLPIPDPNTTPDNADIVSFNCVDNGGVKEFKTSKGLRYVHMCDLEKNAVADPSTGDYTQYAPAADDAWGDPFAQIQIFYHANKAFEYFRSFEGHDTFKLATSDTPLSVVANWLQNPRGIRVNDGGVNVEGGLPEGMDAGDLAAQQPLTPYQNAAYIPYVPGASGPYDLTTVYPDQVKGGVLQFGQGLAADYAYDGQVIYHEFTHAVVGATINLVPYWHMDSQGATPAPGSMNEGLADFFSGAISGIAKLGTYAVKDMQVVGLPSKDCIRDLASQNTCHDMAGEVHFDSIFFSSSLWKVRDSLADDAQKKKFTEAMFTVMHTASGDIGYEDLAEAFVTTLGNTTDQATAKAMTDEFTARGILPQCSRMVEYQGKPLRSSAEDLSYTFISIGPMYFENLSLDYAPSFFQVKVPVAPGSTNLKASFRAIAGGYGGSQFGPQFLVSYGAPIAFDESNKFKPNTTTLFDATTPTADGGVSEGGVSEAGPSSSDEVKNYSATIDVPAGTTEAYVMLVNKGQAEAYYLDLAFTQDGVFVDAGPEAEPEASVDSGAAGSAPGPDAAVDSGTPEGQPATTTPESDEGCGCRVPRSSSGTGALAIGLAAAAMLLRRRR